MTIEDCQKETDEKPKTNNVFVHLFISFCWQKSDIIEKAQVLNNGTVLLRCPSAS